MVSLEKIKLHSYDDLFGTADPKDNEIIEVSLTLLVEPPNHPFQVREDAEMEELVESICQDGVLEPAIVRRLEDGRYEIIAGNRRRRASELAGKKTLPVVIREYSDDDAVKAMVDSNLQRRNILPSEKAKAYRLKYEALKHQGVASGTEYSLEMVGKPVKESGKTVQRYIWLSNLNDGLLQMVDEKKIALVQGIDLSFLSEEEQNWIYDFLQKKTIKISRQMSGRLKELSRQKTLTEKIMAEILAPKEKKRRAVKIRPETINQYFPEEMEDQDIQAVILQLLEQWKRSNHGVGDVLKGLNGDNDSG